METIKYKSQLFAAREQVTVYLRQAQDGLATLGRSVAGRLREALRARANDLRDLLASSHDAMVVTSGKIAKCRSRFFAASERATAHLRQARNTLGRLGRRVVEKPRRLQKILHSRENNLRKLLAGSLDAIVMMDVDRRFVAANPKALDLFGVSETNMKKFTIDAFLSRRETLYFNRNGSPFKGREERHGECKIRRLDGGLRVAEYIFVANFVPYRHLCRFRTVKTAQIKFVEFNSGRGNGSNAFQLH
jgi:PAS domain S-box-containing protein